MVLGAQPTGAPIQVSRSYISWNPLAGPGARFVAPDWKATYRPVALIEAETRLSPFAGVPSGATVTRPITPAVAAAGEAIPNGSGLEIALPELSFTVI